MRECEQRFMKNILFQKWFIAIKVLPWSIGIIILKLILDKFGLEPLSLSPLFNSIIAANVFLLGFLLSGTLTDYKESERLPGELAASIETIYDELKITHKHKKQKVTTEALMYFSDFTSSTLNWFYKKERTAKLMEKIAGLNDFFLSFESLTQPNFIVRLKQEQHVIRRMVIRIHTIRETSFVTVGYAVAEITTALLLVGFLLAKIEPFYESLFFVGIVTFLMTYLIELIRELDNPFEHENEKNEVAIVSLKPLVDLENRIKKEAQEIIS